MKTYKKHDNNYTFSKDISLIIYLCLNLSIGIFSILLYLNYEGYPMLLICSNILFMIVTLPIIFSRLEWASPLFIQMIYLLPQVISLVIKSSGYGYLGYGFTYALSTESYIQAYLKCLLVTSVGLLIEYYVFYGISFRRKTIKIELKNSKLIFLLLLFSWSSFLGLTSLLGGFSSLVNNYTDRITEFSSNTSMYLRMFTVYGTVCVIYYYLVKNKRLFKIALISQVVILLLLGERGGLISNLFIPLFIAFNYSKGRISLKKLFIIAITILIIYEIFGQIRTYGVLLDSSLLERVLNTFSGIQHFYISSQVIYAVDYNYTELLMGKPLLNIIYAPIPRSLFINKPQFIDESALIGSILLNRTHNVYGFPPGVFAYGYINFGWIGVILFSFINARISKTFYDYLLKPYKLGGGKVPNGNILVYSLLVTFSYQVLSTEVQMKGIIIIVALLYIILMSKEKGVKVWKENG